MTHTERRQWDRLWHWDNRHLVAKAFLDEAEKWLQLVRLYGTPEMLERATVDLSARRSDCAEAEFQLRLARSEWDSDRECD